MAHIVGYVKSVEGKFFAKGPDGSVRVLKEGDPVYSNDHIYDPVHNAADRVVIDLLQAQNDLVANGKAEIVFDETVSGDASVTAESSLDEGTVLAALDAGKEANGADPLDALLKEFGDIDVDETAVGDEEVLPRSHESSDMFAAESGAAADVTSTLRGVDSHNYTLHQNYDPFDGRAAAVATASDAGAPTASPSPIAPAPSTTLPPLPVQPPSDTETSNSFTIHDGNGDKVVNADEAGSVSVSGLIEPGGRIDSLTVSDGKETIHVPASAIQYDPDTGRFTAGGIDVTSLSDGTLTVALTSSDRAGNSATTTDTIVKDTTAPEVTIALDESITDDDVINAAEAGETIAIGGTVGGEYHPGDRVTLSVNGTTYTAEVDEHGRFSVEVPGSELAADPNHTIEASITVSDAAGNRATAIDSESYGVDTTAPGAPTVRIVEDANDDGYIDGSELSGGVNVEVVLPSGAEAGDTLRVTDGTTTREIVLTREMVDAGKVETAFDAPADGETVTIEATLTDRAGNSSAPGSDSAVVDTTAPEVTIALDESITDDDVINAAEAGGNVTIGGSVGGDVRDGDTVTLYVNDKAFTGVVNDGRFSIEVPGSDLAADPDRTIEASVTVTDEAGNSTTAADTETYGVDTTLDLTVDFTDGDPSDADNVINHAEQNHARITGTLEAGAVIETMTVTDENGGRVEIDPSQITLNQDGSYAVTADLSSLADGTLKVTVSGKDAYGNTAAATDEILKDTVCPVTIDLAPSSDSGESDSDDLTRDDTPTLQGETDPGAVVTVYRDGEAIGTTTADADGRWSFTAPSAIDRPVTTKVEDSADSNGNELNNTLESAVVFDRSDFGAFPENFGGSDDINGREVPQNVKDPDTLSARFVGAIRNVDPEGSNFPSDGHVDQDWVKVSLKAGEKLILDIDYGAEGNIWTKDGSVDTEIRVFDAEGELVENVGEHIYNHVEGMTTEARQDDDLAPMDGGEGSRLYDRTGADARTLDPYYEFTVPEDGDYYIQVSAFNNGNRYDSGTYELWMSIENPKFDYTATAVDPYGNTGASDTLTVTLDTTAPAVAITSISDDSGTQGDYVTNDNTLVFHGTAEAGSRVELYMDDGKIATVTADNEGKWSYDYSGTVLPDGSHTLKAVATDSAGNSRTVTQSITVDASAVADTPNLHLVSNDFSLGMELEGLTSKSWSGNVDAADIDGDRGASGTEWMTDNGGNKVEVGQENVYLQNGEKENYVIELEGRKGDASNLYTVIENAQKGELYHLEFDYSPRKGHLNDSNIDIYFDGKLVKTLDSSGFDGDHLAMQHYTLDLYVESDGEKRLEFVAQDNNSVGGLMDDIHFGLQPNTGIAGHEIRLPVIDASLSDTDGSERLKVEIEGLPEGSTLSDENGHTFTATASDTVVDVTDWQLDSLLYRTDENGPRTDSLTVKVTSEEIVDGAIVDSAVTTKTVDIHILDQTVTATNLDDTLYFETGHAVDGLAGDDTLILHPDESIDFSNLPAGTRVDNMERIDLSVNGDHELKELTLEDVIEMTDERNTLVIDGEHGDKVNVPDAPAGYSVTQSTDGGYDVYTYTGGSGDPTVTLKIDQDVQHGG